MSEQLPSTMTEAERQLADLQRQDKARRAEWEQWRRHFDATFEALQKRKALLVGGIDTTKVDHGRQVVYVRGDCRVSPQRKQAVIDAKRDLIEGASKLRHEYCGVKNYASFGDQREDHKYGYGPRHGSTVFEVGLTKSARQTETLSNDDVEAALYYLEALPQIQECEANAA